MILTVRPLEVADISAALELFGVTLPEQFGPLPYPTFGPEVVGEYGRSLALQLAGNPDWFAVGAFVDARLCGYISANISHRAIGLPKCICFAELVVVHPEHRLDDIARTLVEAMATEAWARGADVLECAWAPDSLGALVWPAHGLKPYRILGAWVRPDGVARKGVPAP